MVGKLNGVSESQCLADWTDERAWSRRGARILVREFSPDHGLAAQARVLLVGGFHGDEAASVGLVFTWLALLDEHGPGPLHWLVLPALNPDGLLKEAPTRTNAHGVDLNQNFPAPLWREASQAYWRESNRSHPRYNPGPKPLSEPESAFLARTIAEFRPHVIVSVHAPLGLVDYDGPGEPPRGLGRLLLKRLGNHPGTLGHYGELLAIPVLTIELDSITRTPSDAEASAMWADLLAWLTTRWPGLPVGEGLQTLEGEPGLETISFGE